MSRLRGVYWLWPLMLLVGGGSAHALSLNCLMPPASAHLSKAVKIGQKNPMWCWAASTEMAMKAVNASHAVDQCKLAEAYVGVTCCPGLPQNPKCTRGNNSPEYMNNGFTAEAKDPGPLSWDELTQQIACKKSPVPFIYPVGGGTHMVVIVGYKKTGLISKELEIYDPRGAEIYAGGVGTGQYTPRSDYIPYYTYSQSKKKNYYNIRFGP